jgi:hypothetical protein
MGFFDEERETVTEGIYAARLEDCSLDETKEFPRLSVRYKLHSGQTMWQNFTFKDTTKKWISWQIGTIGAWNKAKESCKNQDDLKEVARACLTAIGEFVGSYYDSEVTHREYNGKTYADLKLNQAITQAQAKGYLAPKTTLTKAPEAPKFDASEELPF